MVQFIKRLISVLKKKKITMCIPKLISKMIIRAPLLLAPNASALPAPPAPTTTNCLPVSEQPRGSLLLMCPCSVIFRQYLCVND